MAFYCFSCLYLSTDVLFRVRICAPRGCGCCLCVGAATRQCAAGMRGLPPVGDRADRTVAATEGYNDPFGCDGGPNGCTENGEPVPTKRKWRASRRAVWMRWRAHSNEAGATDGWMRLSRQVQVAKNPHQSSRFYTLKSNLSADEYKIVQHLRGSFSRRSCPDQHCLGTRAPTCARSCDQ